MISACLLGVNCRYDGGSKPVPGLRQRLASFQLAPFCPETLGGLSIPRPPAEISGADGAAVWEGKARVVNRDGLDRTDQFRQGAAATLDLARQLKPVLIICKANSPSCGAAGIYDGTFSGTLRQGDGVTVALLRGEGIPMMTENQLDRELDQFLAMLTDK